MNRLCFKERESNIEGKIILEKTERQIIGTQTVLPLIENSFSTDKSLTH